MLLFIHGIHQSAGVFLPILRSLVGSNSDISDKLLVDSFCLWVPGYDKKDRDFDFKYLEQEIYEFVEQKKHIQCEIADRLLLSSTGIPTQVFKDSKLNLVGCDVGASIAIDFAAQNPKTVRSVAMIDCGNDFANLRSKWAIFKTNRILNNSVSEITKKYQSHSSPYKKIFLGLVANHPAAIGIKSYLSVYKNYNFGHTYNKITLEQQDQFAKIKLLNFVDKKIGLSNNSSTKKLQKILDKKSTIKSKREIFIESKSKDSIQIQPLAIGSDSILDQHVAEKISEKLRLFYI